jgi:hypothetical protein
LLAAHLSGCIIVGFPHRQIPASWHGTSETGFFGESAATSFLKIFFFATAGKTNSNRRGGTCFVAEYFRITRRHSLQKSGNYTALSRVAADRSEPRGALFRVLILLRGSRRLVCATG